MFSIQPKLVPTTWCDTNGCLQILGKATFPMNCPAACQLHKMNKIETPNTIEPSITLNLSSTLNENYVVELDAFTIVVAENQGQGDQVMMFLLYSLKENHGRTASPLSTSVDRSTLPNVTRLISNSINQSHMEIDAFSVLQAEVLMTASMLNVTVLFTFTFKCTSDCQQIQIDKLKNTTSHLLEPIVISYNGMVHTHNASLINVVLATSAVMSISTTEKTITSHDFTAGTTSAPIPKNTSSIFEVNYRLASVDFITESDFQIGPVLNSSTLDELSAVMQTTVSNDSSIATIVLNATITADEGNATTKQSSISSSYILRLIVYYIYSITCNECIQISNNAVMKAPVLQRFIHIRNASLVHISPPISVIKILLDIIPTNISSNDTMSMSTTPLPTSASGDTEHSSENETTGTSSVSSIPTITLVTSSQHQTTAYPSTTYHSTDHTTQHTTPHATQHTTQHSTDHTSTLHQTSPHTTTHTHTTS